MQDFQMLYDVVKLFYGFFPETIEPLDKKEIPRAFKITYQGKVFVLRYFSAERNPESILSDIKVLAFLERSNFPASRIIKTTDSKDFFQLDNRLGFMTTYIAGHHPQQTRETMHQIGNLMAKLHSIQVNQTEVPVSQWNVTVQKEMVRENIQKFSKSNIEHWNEIVPQLIKAYDLLPDFNQLPEVLIHTDLGVHNSIMDSKGELSFIDWDDAGIGSSVFDIGNVLGNNLITFPDLESLDHHFEKELAKSLMKGYQAVRQLSAKEKNLLVEGIEFCVLGYVFMEWIPQIGMRSWARYEFARDNKEEILNTLLG